MVNKPMKKYAAEHNMLAKNNNMYGIKDDYYICAQLTFVQYAAFTEICIPIVNLQQEDHEKIKEFVKANKKALKLLSVEFRQNIVAIKTGVAPNVKKTQFEEALDEIINFYKENSYVSGCSITNETENIVFVFYKGAVMAVNHAVSLQFEEQSRQMDEDNEFRGYLSGIIGACIGGIIGMLSWVLFAMVGYISSLSGLATAWLVKVGYDKAKGKKGGLQFAILIIALIVFTYLGIVASQTYFIVEMFVEEGYSISDIRIFQIFKELITYPFTSEPGASDMRGTIIQGYFFAALGSVYFFISAKKNKEFSAGGQIDTNIQQPVSETAA